MRGVLPLFQQHMPAVIDARRRWLRPGGALVPQVDTLWAAAVEAPELYRPFTEPWVARGDGFDLTPARTFATSAWSKGLVAPQQCLTEPSLLATIDYRTVDSPHVTAEMRRPATREGTAHGVAVWFDSTLADQVHLSNAPGAPELIYGSAFFPLAAPVRLEAGDRVAFAWQARLVGDDYCWVWKMQVRGAGEAPKAAFTQSTFMGAHSADALRRQAADHVPALNGDGRIDQRILQLMGEGRTLEDIARAAAEEFPLRFPRWQDALARAAQLSVKYSD
jgi:protein arginine N-methyltransferase 1